MRGLHFIAEVRAIRDTDVQCHYCDRMAKHYAQYRDGSYHLTDGDSVCCQCLALGMAMPSGVDDRYVTGGRN